MVTPLNMRVFFLAKLPEYCYKKSHMAFNIPAATFLSFGRKQCLDTLWRIGRQLEQHFSNEPEKTAALKSISTYLTTLLGHEDKYIVEQAKALLEIELLSASDLQRWLMHLERELKIDLKDSDFLVSTKDTETSGEKLPIHLVLDNLRSAFNVGSLFRTAEALGVEHIHLCGYTPTPENSKVAKSALGTENWTNWTYWENSLECLVSLKEKGVFSYALETEKNATALLDVEPRFPCALVLGNERYGLGEPVLRRTDELVIIPLSGKKNSLNVGTCGAIVLNHFSSKYS